MVTLKGEYIEVLFLEKDPDNEVPVEVTTADYTYTHYLDQDNIKALIAHLQKQIT